MPHPISSPIVQHLVPINGWIFLSNPPEQSWIVLYSKEPTATEKTRTKNTQGDVFPSVESSEVSGINFLYLPHYRFYHRPRKQSRVVRTCRATQIEMQSAQSLTSCNRKFLNCSLVLVLVLLSLTACLGYP